VTTQVEVARRRTLEESERGIPVRKTILRAAAAALAVALLPVPGAGAQQPDVDASVNQFAYATNIIHIDGHDYMYLVGAERISHAAGDTKTKAFAKRTKCLTLEKKHIKLIACAAFVFPRRIPDEDFAFDPLMDSASVRMTRDGARTAMRWTGRGTPEPGVSPYADESYGVGVYGDLFRAARARGRILDERYPPRGMGFAVLIEGAAVEGYTGEDVTISRTRNGGLRITALYEVPR
jgi:hypothetical protein